MDKPKQPKRRKRPAGSQGTLTGPCTLDGTPAEQDAALEALAGVIVDELMLHKKQGLTPAQIRAMYQADGSGPSQPI